MRGTESETKIVQFQDNYLEAYFADGTTMAWLNDSITYYSLKGNRIKVSIDSLKFTEDVARKLATIVDSQNAYNDHYIELPKHLRGEVKAVFKKYKIKSYTWSSPAVRRSDRGYEVVSDDNNARLWLAHDLFRVGVQYLQLTSFRQVSKEEQYLLGSKNQRRLLLQKYSYKYTEFPSNGCVSEIENQYHQITKQFTIFNLPPRWCPAIKLIWSYILANQLIPHPFCYIDFSEPENRRLASIEDSVMPTHVSLQDYKKYEQNDKFLEVPAFPLYGKPNHSFKFKWMHVYQAQINLVGYACEGTNIICQNEGFWFIEGSKVIYNAKNKDKCDYEVALNAFPITVRFQNQPARQLKPHVTAFSAYLDHRELLIRKDKAKVSKKVIESEDDIIFEQFVEGVGVFKAFRNHMAKGNFDDRIIITIRESEIKVIDAVGKCWLVGSDPILNSKFGWHIDRLSDFYQKIFDPEAYRSRMELNQLLEERKQLSSVFMQVTKHVKSKDY